MSKKTAEKPAEKAPEVKPEAVKPDTRPDFAIRHLTPEETKTLMEDDSLPEGLATTAVATEEPPEKEEVKEEKAEEKKEEEPLKTEIKPEEDTFVKIERELAKDEGRENLKDFSPREKAYFYQMRRDRKLRQKAEEERDQALFRERKSKEKPPEDPLKVLEGREDEDFLTVKDVKAMLKKEAKENKETPREDAGLQNMQMNYLKMCEREALQKHEDFEAVIDLADELIANDTKALTEVAERTKKGENPAIVMYEMIRSHKEFETLYPAAEIRVKARKQAAEKTPGASSSAPVSTPEDKAKEEKAKQAEKALEDNANKSKTTAHVSSREGKPAEELSLEEINKMSDLEFAKLPRQVRNKYLKAYGA